MPLSPTLLRMRRVETSVVTVLVAAVAAAIAGAAGSGVAAAVAAAVAVVAGAATLRFVGNRFRAWGYRERTEDLEVRRGVLIQRLSVVPYGRMQFVEITAGPVERLFGLSTVRLHTAAAASDARIPGLAPDEATRVRDRLAALGEARAAGL